MRPDSLVKDVGLAALIVALGAVLAWVLSGGLPVIGIDDAAITRSYAENLANGAGYVYNVGGERVEGSTALLWTLLLTVLYTLTPTPEVLIVGLAATMTVVSVTCILRLTRFLERRLTGEAEVAVVAVSVLLIANLGYFMWSVWSMMELALWSMLLIL
ncbi:MAG: hypothetical protein AAFQ51_11820, partial [Pseudomonadota bacterium]